MALSLLGRNGSSPRRCAIFQLERIGQIAYTRVHVPTQTRNVRPGPTPHTVLTEDGQTLTVPQTWALLPPGDAGLTRRVKKAGPSWTVREKRGRKIFSQGVWAPSQVIQTLTTERQSEVEDPRYQKKLETARERRAEQQAEYADTFYQTVRNFLAFDTSYEAEEIAMATAISDHAVPVGSNTVARTQRIPIEDRAAAATIAWMRHQTTAYDSLKIPRVKGMRRQVRRMLAQRSHSLLEAYRNGSALNPATCPLQQALGTMDDGEPVG